jgi:hypothetical protein
MAALEKRPEREIFETGAEPDYQINDIIRYEDAGDGMIRLYFASHRGNMDRIECTAHYSPETLMRLGLRCQQIAAEFLDVGKFRKALREH